MIIVKNAEKGEIIKNISIERTFLTGLVDNINLLKNTSPEVKNDIFEYIRRNAVFNGISEHAKRNVSSKHDIIESIQFGLTNAISLLDYIEDKISKSNKKIYDDKSISYREKGMFDWLRAISFFGNYSSKFLDVVLTQPKSINNFLTKADFEFLNKTVGYYNTLLKRVCDSQKNLKTSIEMLSEEIYDPETESLIREVKGPAATTVGIAPHSLNPGYWVRYARMRLDVRTVKSNSEKIDMYSMKIQQLENKKNNNPDPSIDRQIEYWQNEIQVLDGEILEIEERYAD